MAFEEIRDFYSDEKYVDPEVIKSTARRYYRQWNSDRNLSFSPTYGRNIFESLLMAFELHEEGEIDLDGEFWQDEEGHATDNYDEILNDYIDFRPEQALEFDPVEAVRINLEEEFDVEHEDEGLRVRSGSDSGKVVPYFLRDTLGIEFPTESVQYFTGDSVEVPNPVSKNVSDHLEKELNLAEHQRGIENGSQRSGWAWYRISDLGLGDESISHEPEEVEDGLDELGLEYERAGGDFKVDLDSEDLIVHTRDDGVELIRTNGDSFAKNIDSTVVGELSNLEAVINHIMSESDR